MGMITFGDHREDMWNNVFGKQTEPRHRLAIKALSALPVELVVRDEVARTAPDIDSQVDFLRSAGAEILVAHTPCWTSPNLVVRGVQRAQLPVILLGNRDPGTHGAVGLLGASGALGQIGYAHAVVRCDYDSPDIGSRILPLVRAAAVKARLRGSVFGHFGGRSIGIDTAQFDPMQWRKLFGIDAEHIDQVEILRLAEKVDPQRVRKMREWIEKGAKSVRYNDAKFTQDKFDYELACYLATKDIVKQARLDFVAIKCMPELSNSYIPQCMTQAFLADVFDGDEGEKESVPVACEADADGALTQYILNILSGGMPTFFADLSHINDKESVFYCVNCGAVCAWYAGRCSDPAGNLARITIQQSVRPSGGGITYFHAAPGPMQLARLYRKDGKYHMAIIPCMAVEPSKEMVDEFVEARGPHQLPALFAKVGFDIDAFLDSYGSNHISGIAGNYEKELLAVCKLLDIVPEVFK
jgi:L-fucose isomerase